MSTYIHIFAGKGTTFVELLCYSGSSVLYRALHHNAPYEKIRLLSADSIRDGLNGLSGELQSYKNANDEDRKIIHEIGSWNNTIDEKLDAISEITLHIDERNEEIEEIETAMNILRFLLNIESDLYIGEECGSDVTIDDIVE